MTGGFSPEGLPEAFLTRMERMLGKSTPISSPTSPLASGIMASGPTA